MEICSAVHCTHCTLYTAHYTLKTVYCKLQTVDSSLQTLDSTICTLHFTLYTLHSTLYDVHFTLHGTLYTKLYNPYSVHLVDGSTFTSSYDLKSPVEITLKLVLIHSKLGKDQLSKVHATRIAAVNCTLSCLDKTQMLNTSMREPKNGFFHTISNSEECTKSTFFCVTTFQ